MTSFLDRFPASHTSRSAGGEKPVYIIRLDRHLLQNSTLNRVWSVCTCFRFGHQRPLFALERHRSRGKCPNLPVLPKLSKFPSQSVDPRTLLILHPSGPLKHCLSALNLPNHPSPLKSSLMLIKIQYGTAPSINIDDNGED